MLLPTERRPAALAAWLLLWLMPTVWFGLRQLDRGIDTTNAAMKAAGTPEAAASAAVQQAFGSAETVLLCFCDRAGLPLGERQRQRIDELRQQLADLPGVAAASAPPSSAADLGLLGVQVGEAGAAAAVVAAARQGCPSTLELHASGLPLFEAALSTAIAGERARMVPWITGVLFLLAWLLFGRLRLALALLLPALAAIAWTGGLLQLLGRPLDPVGVLLEPVLMTVGVAGAVHFALAAERAQRRGHAAGFAAAFAARSLRGPALLAAATTMVGFLALALNRLPAVAQFGVHAAFGTALANAFCFVLLPAALPLCGRPRPQRSTAAANRFTAWLRRRRGPALLLTAALAIAAGVGLQQLRIDNEPLLLLPPAHPFRVDHELLVDRLGGVDAFDLLVPAGSKAQAPERLLPFAAAALTMPGVAGLAGPPQRAASGDVRVPLRLRPGGSGERERLFVDLRARAGLLGLDGVEPAGGLVQIATDSDQLVRGQLLGLLATFACLFVCLALGFRSPRTGLAALLPAALPCLLLYGGIGLCGYPVSVATAMIGSVMLGLVVDNTIHFVHHFRHARRSLAAAAAVRRALAEVGRPMWISAAVLATGFATGLCGSMRSTAEFGALASLGMALALVASLVVLPAALLRAAAGRRA